MKAYKILKIWERLTNFVNKLVLKLITVDEYTYLGKWLPAMGEHANVAVKLQLKCKSCFVVNTQTKH